MAFLILLYFFDSIIFVVSLIRCFVLIYLFTLTPLLTLVHSFLCSHHCPYQIIFYPIRLFITLIALLLLIFLLSFLFLLLFIHFFAIVTLFFCFSSSHSFLCSPKKRIKERRHGGNPLRPFQSVFPRDPHPLRYLRFVYYGLLGLQNSRCVNLWLMVF